MQNNVLSARSSEPRRPRVSVQIGGTPSSTSRPKRRAAMNLSENSGRAVTSSSEGKGIHHKTTANQSSGAAATKVTAMFIYACLNSPVSNHGNPGDHSALVPPRPPSRKIGRGAQPKWAGLRSRTGAAQPNMLGPLTWLPGPHRSGTLPRECAISVGPLANIWEVARPTIWVASRCYWSADRSAGVGAR